MQRSLAVDCVPSWGKRVVCRRRGVSTVVEKCVELREMRRAGAKSMGGCAKMAYEG
jgi:predicted transcriptional regulator